VNMLELSKVFNGSKAFGTSQLSQVRARLEIYTVLVHEFSLICVDLISALKLKRAAYSILYTA